MLPKVRVYFSTGKAELCRATLYFRVITQSRPQIGNLALRRTSPLRAWMARGGTQLSRAPEASWVGVPSPGSLTGILSPCTQVTHRGRRPVPLHSSPSVGILDPSLGHLTWAPPHLGTPQETIRTPWSGPVAAPLPTGSLWTMTPGLPPLSYTAHFSKCP